jgi:hypothetical protein
MERIQVPELLILTHCCFWNTDVCFQGITMSNFSRRWPITSNKYVVMFYDPTSLIVLQINAWWSLTRNHTGRLFDNRI